MLGKQLEDFLNILWTPCGEGVREAPRTLWPGWRGMAAGWSFPYSGRFKVIAVTRMEPRGTHRNRSLGYYPCAMQE